MQPLSGSYIRISMDISHRLGSINVPRFELCTTGCTSPSSTVTAHKLLLILFICILIVSMDLFILIFIVALLDMFASFYCYSCIGFR